MWKFIHAADIRIDSSLCGLERYEGAPVEEIHSATRRAFDNLIDLAIEAEVAFILLVSPPENWTSILWHFTAGNPKDAWVQFLIGKTSRRINLRN